ncbi:class I SAM-dependent methyltransferase [Sphingomonas parapaucimobilis]|uniref:Putative DNA methyltransferase n=1 Tax=Sphingomonas parapaucimobilis NBRC 15100 TaxID=1219049 RepID=A0A0A1W8E4_9SPHN|nr:class I SAM-dependent methyltransferase [Sphingomonas parapaucimobilis]GAM01720.1 putative DNA methyltransferase [Sphingomonas parapaucimobilis NBRC 15100]
MSASVPANQRTVGDLIEEYEVKAAGVEDAIKAFEAAHDALQMAGTVQGCYVEPIGSKSYLHASSIRKNLLSSAWKAIYNRLDIGRVASAKDKQLFERTIADPPPLTMDTAKATFGDYLIRPRYHILRGLAEAFADLDPAYKSHAKVRVGVRGLPKRIILSGWGDYSSGYGVDRFENVVNALATYQGLPHITWGEIRDVARTGDTAMPDRGLTVRRFQNGNCHVIFDSWALVDINRALGEFYGEVLPDAEEEGVKPSASTAVAKDLQFYWTPEEVVEEALEYASVWNSNSYSGQRPPLRVLEPSCGDGRILDGIRSRGYQALGIEYHPGRASQARAKGHSVVTANFLEQTPTPEFDRVVMNPPFYGRHYAHHVRHAYRFLKPGGTLVSILPATAHYDHGELEGEWRDLPVGSFSAAGTNVPTGLLRMRKAA